MPTCLDGCHDGGVSVHHEELCVGNSSKAIGEHGSDFLVDL